MATVGPATESEAVLEKLFNHGVNVVRLNFSHGDFAEHGLRIKRTRALAKKLNQPIAILQDLAGPKIRLGEFNQERVTLKEGAKFTLTTKEQIGDESIAYINYPKLPSEVKKGQIIFLDDGKKKLIVEKVVGDKIHCQILVGGETKGRRGVNVPGAYLSISSLTDKDKKDLEFGIKEGVDYMALSFVRRPEDILELRAILAKRKAEGIKIIAKIETQEAIDNIDAILAVTDAVMVARGDLAIEIPAEEVPFWQKNIITKCNKLGKPVITATQMLESMISSPVPTRAEVSDVANAIFDGTDAVMLSEETTLGKFPLKAIEVMYRVAVHTEKSRDSAHFLTREHLTLKTTLDALAYSAINMAHETSAGALAAYTNSGRTAHLLSRFRPNMPILVFTGSVKIYNQLALSYGCYPLLVKAPKSLLAFGDLARKTLLDQTLVKKGQTIILVAGLPFNKLANQANMIFAETA